VHFLDCLLRAPLRPIAISIRIEVRLIGSSNSCVPVLMIIVLMARSGCCCQCGCAPIVLHRTPIRNPFGSLTFLSSLLDWQAPADSRCLSLSGSGVWFGVRRRRHYDILPAPIGSDCETTISVIPPRWRTTTPQFLVTPHIVPNPGRDSCPPIRE
jgi:hypothetical protein